MKGKLDSYDVELTIHSIEGVDVGKYGRPCPCQLVWEGLGEQKQTSAVQPADDGTVKFASTWKLGVTVESGPATLNLAAWVYPGGSTKPVNIGLLAVRLRPFDAQPSQQFSTKWADSDKLVVNFSVEATPRARRKRGNSPLAPKVVGPTEPSPKAAQPDPGGPLRLSRPSPSVVWGLHLGDGLTLGHVDEDGAAAASDPRIRSCVGCVLSHVNGVAVSTQEQIVAMLVPATEVELTFSAPEIDAALVSPAELRVWLAEVLAVAAPTDEAVTLPSAVGLSCITDGTEYQITPAGQDPSRTLALILDEPLMPARGRARADQPSLSQNAISERLRGGALEAYLSAVPGGDHIVRRLREETSSQLLDLVRLPRHMARRLHANNGAATLFAMHLMQYHGMMKADADLQKTREARAAVVRNSVVYVNSETYDEWEDTRVLQSIAFELPMLSLRRVDACEATQVMDVALLRRMIDEDASQGAVPAAVVARVGAEGYSASDDIDTVISVCRDRKLWLHIEGPAVFFLSSRWPQFDGFRREVEKNVLNCSVTVCEDEMPGLKKLPGFWVFSCGKGCGVRQLPRDASPDADLSVARLVIPSWLRLRQTGCQSVAAQLEARCSDADRLRAVLKEINQRSAVAGASAVARLHTHPNNSWNIRFTILPGDHPLISHESPDDVRAEVDAHPVSLERINTTNRAVHRMVRDGSGGQCAFELQDHNGLLWWCFALTVATVSDAEAARLREAVLGAAENMLCVSHSAEAVSTAIEDLPQLNVTRRGLEQNPLELCAFRLTPRFYDAQDQLSDGDLRDIQRINESLCAKLRDIESECEARFGFVGHGQGVAVTTCSLPAAKDLTAAEVAAVASVVSRAVSAVLTTDETVLRIEDEMTRRGIAVAEAQLQQSAARYEEMVQQNVVRTVPVVGDMVNWLLPIPQINEGLHFDLTTSTLQKEERALDGDAAVERRD